MSNNTNKTGNAHKWFPILLAVLVLLAIITNRDDSGTDAGDYKGKVDGNTSTHQSQPSDAVLAAVPAELRNNVYLDKKGMGCCKTLSGDVAVSVVMISDSIGQWDEESTANLKTALEANGQDIVSQAEAHQIALSLSFHYYNATMTGDICGGVNTNDWQDPALESAGLPALKNLHDHLAKKYGSKEAPVVFVFNKPGRAFAGGGGANEYVVLYARKDFDAFQHELSHVFGAKDYYYPKEVKTLANAAFPDSIMCSGETVDPLTAYLIGWTDTVSENTLQFLKDTNEITAEYINAERKEEQYTGYGTKEFEAGTYTGDLVRGQCHGQGTMHYDNGGWYTGQWSYGAWSGTGTGKYTYKSGNTYEGEFLDGQCHGTGTMHYTDGGWYKGQWQEGKWSGSGTGKNFYDNGDIYEGSYLNGKRHGQGTYTYANGGWITGSWSEGAQKGTATGKMIYDNGDAYEGSFLNGKRHGQGTYTWSNGGWITGNWSNGEQSGAGRGKRIYNNGVYEGEFLNGKLHGQGTYSYQNGDKYTGQWANGDRHGYGTYTFASGNTKKGYWNNGDFVK